MPLFSRIDHVQSVRDAAAKPQLPRDELVFDHPDLDGLRTRPVDGYDRVAVAWPARCNGNLFACPFGCHRQHRRDPI